MQEALRVLHCGAGAADGPLEAPQHWLPPGSPLPHLKGHAALRQRTWSLHEAPGSRPQARALGGSS